MTVRQKAEEGEDPNDNTFALSQAEQDMSVMEDPVKDLQDELALRTKSLQDALGENDTLRSRGQQERTGGKQGGEEGEGAGDNLGVIQSLSLACHAPPPPPPAAKTSKEDELKMSRLKDENNSLLAKLTAKKKEVESLKIKLKDTNDLAATSNRLANGFEQHSVLQSTSTLTSPPTITPSPTTTSTTTTNPTTSPTLSPAPTSSPASSSNHNAAPSPATNLADTKCGPADSGLGHRDDEEPAARGTEDRTRHSSVPDRKCEVPASQLSEHGDIVPEGGRAEDENVQYVNRAIFITMTN